MARFSGRIPKDIKEAIAAWCDTDQLNVCMTKAARAESFDDFREAIGL